MSVTSSFRSLGGKSSLHGSLLIRLICIKACPEWRNDQSSSRGRTWLHRCSSRTTSRSRPSIIYAWPLLRRECCFHVASRKFVGSERMSDDNSSRCWILINELPCVLPHPPTVQSNLFDCQTLSSDGGKTVCGERETRQWYTVVPCTRILTSCHHLVIISDIQMDKFNCSFIEISALSRLSIFVLLRGDVIFISLLGLQGRRNITALTPFVPSATRNSIIVAPSFNIEIVRISCADAKFYGRLKIDSKYVKTPWIHNRRTYRIDSTKVYLFQQDRKW